MEIVVLKNGRVVIPSWIRELFEVKSGTRILIEIDNDEHRIILKPITRKYIDGLRGKFKGKGLMKALSEDKM